MNLSAVRADSLLGKVLRLPLRAIPRASTVRVLQGPLRGTKWIVGASNHGCWLGTYEREQQERFNRDSAGVVYDIGANAGLYSLIAARRAEKVVAVEPLPRNIGYLRQHLALNHFTNCSVVEGVVSDHEGTEHFEFDDPIMGHIGGSKGFPVRCFTIDGLAERFGAPRMIKLDVEGAEALALQGASRTLAESRPIVYLSIHTHENRDTCLELFRSQCYTIEWISKFDCLVARPA
jgi:FkbM family methyltransferase